MRAAGRAFNSTGAEEANPHGAAWCRRVGCRTRQSPRPGPARWHHALNTQRGLVPGAAATLARYQD